MAGVGDSGDVAADVGGRGLAQEDPKGKHIVIGVENFSNAMNAYLRLGAASPKAGTADPATGEDLASLVHGFTDDTRDRGTGEESTPAPAQSFDPAFQALFTGDASIGPRRVESAILHTKGGWRDHSDGNRITTTRGDKVEVIQGNYKLVVLGRQDDATAYSDPAARRALLENSAGMDLSGGQNDVDGDVRYGSEPDAGGSPDGSRDQADLAIEYQWGQDSDGSYGWKQTTTVGHEHPADGQRRNYRIINCNYVDYQEDNYGSDGQPIAKMISRTYASGVDDSYYVEGVNSTQLSGNTVENYQIAAHVLTHNVAAIMNEVDLAATIASAQIAGASAYAAVGAVVNTNAGITMDNHLGAHVDVHAGMHIDTRTGLHTDVHTGTHVDLHLGTHTELHTGTHFQFDTDAITLNIGSYFKLHMPAGTLTWVTGMAGETVVRAKGHTNVVGAAAAKIAAAHMIV
jgi:hypothetical protein